MMQTVEYITLQLLQGNADEDEEVQGLLNKYDFYVFPFVNPDGKPLLNPPVEEKPPAVADSD